MAKNNKVDNSKDQFSNPLDDNLLNRPAKSGAEKSGELREAQRDQSPEQSNPAPQGQDETTIREQQVAAKREAALSEEAEEKKEEQSSGPNPVNKATSNLLKKAWLNLVDSYGLTLIWINIHVFLGTVFSEKFFCKLGMEWMNTNIKQAQFAEAKKLGKVAGNFEGAGLACLDLGCLLLVIAILMIISIIFDVFSLEGLSRIMGWFWSGSGFTN